MSDILVEHKYFRVAWSRVRLVPNLLLGHSSAVASTWIGSFACEIWSETNEVLFICWMFQILDESEHCLSVWCIFFGLQLAHKFAAQTLR